MCCDVFLCNCWDCANMSTKRLRENCFSVLIYMQLLLPKNQRCSLVLGLGDQGWKVSAEKKRCWKITNKQTNMDATSAVKNVLGKGIMCIVGYLWCGGLHSQKPWRHTNYQCQAFQCPSFCFLLWLSNKIGPDSANPCDSLDEREVRVT